MNDHFRDRYGKPGSVGLAWREVEAGGGNGLQYNPVVIWVALDPHTFRRAQPVDCGVCLDEELNGDGVREGIGLGRYETELGGWFLGAKGVGKSKQHSGILGNSIRTPYQSESGCESHNLGDRLCFCLVEITQSMGQGSTMLFSAKASARNLVDQSYQSPTLDLTISAKFSFQLDRALAEEQKIAILRLKDWVGEIHRAAHDSSHSVCPAIYTDLREYFSHKFLESTVCHTVIQCPEIPYRALGLNGDLFPHNELLHGFATGAVYFLREELKDWMPIHFHELIHVVQARLVGLDNFLGLLFLDYSRGSYRSSPLEKMAYSLQDRYTYGRRPFDAVSAVREELSRMSDFEG